MLAKLDTHKFYPKTNRKYSPNLLRRVRRRISKILYGTEIFNGDLVIGINALERSPLSASEIPGIAELGLSTLGKTFKLLDPDEVGSGIYAGYYR